MKTSLEVETYVVEGVKRLSYPCNALDLTDLLEKHVNNTLQIDIIPGNGIGSEDYSTKYFGNDISSNNHQKKMNSVVMRYLDRLPSWRDLWTD